MVLVRPQVTAIEIPPRSLFSLDNLPYGVFEVPGAAPRVGVRAGDSVIDLGLLLDDDTFAAPSLNRFMSQGRARWTQVRAQVTELITARAIPEAAIHPVAGVALRLPFEVADYVDFYACEHHASNLGRLFRPGAPPLMPNWKHMPVGYHGRAGTVVVSGTSIVRPRGQRKAQADAAPVFGPSVRLDIEAELGFVVGTGSPLGTPIPVADFADHVFGALLVNDWSARDIQSWEYVPLGPHLGKSFATSVSPWVVPLAALEAARIPLPGQEPEPLPYLRETGPGGLDIDLVVTWNGAEVSRPPYREMYWSPAQMLAHMTAGGATARTGDLFASGTISGPARAQCGSLIELTRGGAEPVTVNGQARTFLSDDDEVVISATAPGADGGRIGFGEVRGTIVSALGTPIRGPLPGR
ncbi:MAG TPA: fumarylacetoacetase [Trebonia sp.]|jgi:fumarylacetoacetase